MGSRGQTFPSRVKKPVKEGKIDDPKTSRKVGRIAKRSGVQSENNAGTDDSEINAKRL